MDLLPPLGHEHRSHSKRPLLVYRLHQQRWKGHREVERLLAIDREFRILRRLRDELQEVDEPDHPPLHRRRLLRSLNLDLLADHQPDRCRPLGWQQATG